MTTQRDIMSISSLIKARLSFLDRGARKIHRSAPSVGSAMEAEHDKLTRHNGRHTPKDIQSRRREVCLACGNLFELEQHDPRASEMENPPAVPLSSSAKRRVRAKNLRRASNSDAGANTSSKSTMQQPTIAEEETRTCPRCLRKTRSKQPRTSPSEPRSKKPRQINDGNVQQSTAARSNPSRQFSSANRSSKQRAKARKQGGLQAILAKTKASHNTGPDLDLMDFKQV